MVDIETPLDVCRTIGLVISSPLPSAIAEPLRSTYRRSIPVAIQWLAKVRHLNVLVTLPE